MEEAFVKVGDGIIAKMQYDCEDQQGYIFFQIPSPQWEGKMRNFQNGERTNQN